jgi:hypothetical protein
MPGPEVTFVYIKKKTNLKTENAGPGGKICIYKKDKPENRKCRAGR